MMEELSYKATLPLVKTIEYVDIFETCLTITISQHFSRVQDSGAGSLQELLVHMYLWYFLQIPNSEKKKMFKKQNIVSKKDKMCINVLDTFFTLSQIV